MLALAIVAFASAACGIGTIVEMLRRDEPLFGLYGIALLVTGSLVAAAHAAYAAD